jgi:glyoxylase-like metal-dependent hydrolase (beta-lactamase superfamily II)
MFGVVPKVIWNKTNPADSNNLIDIAARCLLIENGNRLTLIDNGMGTKQPKKFFDYYHQWGNHSIDASLQTLGYHRDDITDLFMTHLHFDHCGGSIQWNKNRTGYEPAFKNAKFWTNKSHWEWAVNPNNREKASFLKENLIPMQESGQLCFMKEPDQNNDFIATSELDFGVLFIDGHTEKQMIPHINYNGKTICFMADLIPTLGHLKVPYVTGYDTRPLLSLDEKSKFLNLAANHNYYLFLEHDAHHEIVTVKHSEKGVVLNERFRCEDVFK